MSRYIDADAAYEAACEGADNWDGGCSPYRDDCIREELDKVPTVDAVQVVRCQYCKWWKKYRNDNDWGLCEKHDIDHPCNCEWFCADGERRME